MGKHLMFNLVSHWFIMTVMNLSLIILLLGIHRGKGVAIS